MNYRRVTAALVAIISTLFAALLVATLSSLWQQPAQSLRDAVQAALPESRVGNPVTAVLLDYRGYDTLLEFAVLLLAGLAAAPVTGRAAASAMRIPSPYVDKSVGRLLIAPIVLTAASVLWVGADAPGGAFQAGAIGAAAAVVLRLSGTLVRPLPGQQLLSPMALAVFLIVGFACLAMTGAFLGYPRAAVRELILCIEIAAAVSVSMILAGLFETLYGIAGRRA